jgi:N-acetylmuramoyl-L-alanine amidase
MVHPIISAPSPNHDSRGDAEIDLLVLHYTGMQTGAEALARLRDEEAKVSAHYLVEEDGRIFSLVDEERRAWHAGISHWAGVDNVNDNSIGIEVVNPGHEWGYRAFPQAQVDALLYLVEKICVGHKIPSSRVVGHSDVAPMRKEDPGELFPWDQLARTNLAIGYYRDQEKDLKNLPGYDDCLTMLREIGYHVPERAHAAAVLAFQRRIVPSQLGKGLDPQTKRALVWAHQAFTKS